MTSGAATLRDMHSARVDRLVIDEWVEDDIETHSPCSVPDCVVEDRSYIVSDQALGSHDIRVGCGPFVDVEESSLMILSDF